MLINNKSCRLMLTFFMLANASICASNSENNQTSDSKLSTSINNVNAAFDNASSSIDSTTNNIQNGINTSVSSISSSINVAQISILSAVNSCKTTATNAMTNASRLISEYQSRFKEESEKSREKLSSIRSNIKDSVSNIMSNIKDSLSNIKDAVSNITSNLNPFKKTYTEQELESMRKSLSKETIELLTNTGSMFIKQHIDTINNIKSIISDDLLTSSKSFDYSGGKQLSPGVSNDIIDANNSLRNAYDILLKNTPNTSVGLQLLIDSTGGSKSTGELFDVSMGVGQSHKDALTSLYSSKINELIKFESSIMSLSSAIQESKDENMKSKMTELLEQVSSYHEALGNEIKQGIIDYQKQYDSRNSTKSANNNIYFDVEGFYKHVDNVMELDPVQKVQNTMLAKQKELEQFGHLTTEEQYEECRKLSDEFSTSLETDKQTFINQLQNTLENLSSTEACVNYPASGDQLPHEYEKQLKKELLSLIENMPNSSHCLNELLQLTGGSFSSDDGTTKSHRGNINELLQEKISTAKQLEATLQSGYLPSNVFNEYKNNLDNIISSIKSDISSYITESHKTSNTKEHVYIDYSALHSSVEEFTQNSHEELTKVFELHEGNDSAAHLASRTNAKAQQGTTTE